jgi:hypothetical protein
MTLPGFTAEAAAYRSVQLYRLAAPIDAAAGGTSVVPSRLLYYCEGGFPFIWCYEVETSFGTAGILPWGLTGGWGDSAGEGGGMAGSDTECFDRCMAECKILPPERCALKCRIRCRPKPA